MAFFSNQDSLMEIDTVEPPKLFNKDSSYGGTNWKAILTPSTDWAHMHNFQTSVMTGVVSGSPNVLCYFANALHAYRLVSLRQAFRRQVGTKELLT